jgi:hypothetical protein
VTPTHQQEAVQSTLQKVTELTTNLTKTATRFHLKTLRLTINTYAAERSQARQHAELRTSPKSIQNCKTATQHLAALQPSRSSAYVQQRKGNLVVERNDGLGLRRLQTMYASWLQPTVLLMQQLHELKCMQMGPRRLYITISWCHPGVSNTWSANATCQTIANSPHFYWQTLC